MISPDPKGPVARTVERRRSVRAFLSRPVEEATIRDLLAQASRAPSGGNLQPWRVWVSTGADLQRLKSDTAAFLMANARGEETEYPIYPSPLFAPYDVRRKDNAEGLYGAIGVPREDRAGRLSQFARNFVLFDAPAGLFFAIDRRFGPGQWAHMGMFLQTLMLLAEEAGLATCAQEAWAAVHSVVERHFALPSDLIFYCGLALGHADPDAPVNAFRTDRAPVEDFAVFRR